MFNIRKYVSAVTPLRNLFFYSTKPQTHKSRSHSSRRKKPQKAAPNFHPDFNFGINAGVQGQLSSVQLDEKELQDPDIVDKLEKQFWDSDKMYKLLEGEDLVEKEFIGLHQVLRKQHREAKLPNMLLWNEKQEIKARHAEDPEKWTIMKLAFSYPASPNIIKKVLKTNWKLRSHKEIEKHDERVRRNWEALAKGKLDLPDENLKRHVMSFSDRRPIYVSDSKDIALIEESKDNSLNNVLKDGGVFGSIYKSYKQLKQSDDKKHTQNTTTERRDESSIESGLKILSKPPVNDTFIIPCAVQNVSVRNVEPKTLREMQKKILGESKMGKTLSDDEKAFFKKYSVEGSEGGNYMKLNDPIGCTLNKEGYDAKKSGKQLDQPNFSNESHLTGQLNQDEIVKKQTVTDKDFTHDENDRSDEYSVDRHLSSAHKYVDFLTQPEPQDKQNEDLQIAFQTAKLHRTKEDSAAITKAVKDYISKSDDSYPLQIEIPKDLYRKGALYRVKDRFYNDSGEFLYRVPGLVKG